MMLSLISMQGEQNNQIFLEPSLQNKELGKRFITYGDNILGQFLMREARLLCYVNLPKCVNFLYLMDLEHN